MVKIISDEDEPIDAEVLESAIVKIADGFEALLDTKLNQKAIIALLKDMPGMTGVSKGQIKAVLENLKDLKKHYLRKE